jgi:hypothetical protein
MEPAPETEVVPDSVNVFVPFTVPFTVMLPDADEAALIVSVPPVFTVTAASVNEALPVSVAPVLTVSVPLTVVLDEAVTAAEVFEMVRLLNV